VQQNPSSTSSSTSTKKNTNYTNGYANNVITNTNNVNVVTDYQYGNNGTQQQISQILTGGNTYSPPYVDLSGGAGGPNFDPGTTYGGPNWWAHIAPNATITYTGGNITSMIVTLTNRPDGSAEYLGFYAGYNPSSFGLYSSGYSSYTGQLVISGYASPAYFQNALRSIVYVDTNTNPTLGERTISLLLSGTNETTGNTAFSTLTVAQDPSLQQQKKNTNYGTGGTSTGGLTVNVTKQQLTNLSNPSSTPPPYVNLPGDSTGPNWSTWNYGGNYYTHIAPSGTISYGGATLSSMIVTAWPRPDLSSEYFSVLNYDNKDKNNPLSYEYNPGTGWFTVTGTASTIQVKAPSGLPRVVFPPPVGGPRQPKAVIPPGGGAGLRYVNLPNTVNLPLIPKGAIAPGSATAPPPARRTPWGEMTYSSVPFVAPMNRYTGPPVKD
jgi:hypothetical protein